jgi:BRCA1-associated RING domain protein 1
VYFVGETVKNLKAEVARGTKLKCTKCSLKGAALGCYVKSCRRTYHVPCAMDISTCRWDHVQFSYISALGLFFNKSFCLCFCAFI